MAIYDVAGAMRQYDGVGSLQQGLSYGNALADLRRKRAEDDRRAQISAGLQQFMRMGAPDRVEMDVQGPNLLDMAGQASRQAPMMTNSPVPVPRVGNAMFRQMTQPAPLPTTLQRTIPAQPGGFDFEGAANYLASQGQFQDLGALAALRKMTAPDSIEYSGSNPYAARTPDGRDVLIAMTNRGPQELPYLPKPEAPKVDVKGGWIFGPDGQPAAPLPMTPAEKLRLAMEQRRIQRAEEADARAAAAGSQLDLKDRAQIEQSYRKEFNALNSAYGEIKRSRGNILSSLGQNSAAGDLAAATSLMKMLDPGSVVRESELTMAQNATGAIDRVYNYAQMVANGQRLNPQQRAEYVRLANDLFGNSEKEYKNRATEYSRIAKEYGLKAENIVGSSAAPVAQTNSKGWKLYTDAKGNRAYVSPDGTQFEEVK